MIANLQAILIAGALAGSNASNDLEINNVHIYNAKSQSFSEPQTIYINDGKIVDLKKNKKVDVKSIKTIDGQGKYLLPGFIDLHVHLGSSGSNYSEFQYLPVASHFNSNLYLGITSVTDLFSFDNTITEAKEYSKLNLAPDLFYAGALFTNPGGHGTQFGGVALEIESDEDIDRLWKIHLAKKPKLTKAVIESFGGHGSTLTNAQLSKLAKLSKQEELPFFVHVSTLTDAKRAIKSGATALAHGVNLEEVDNELITMMLENNVAYIPTLAVFYNQVDEKNGQSLSSQKHLLKPIHKKLQACLFDNVTSPSKWQQQASDKRTIAYNNIKKLYQAGVIIGTGSDAGNPYTLHGVGLHNEFSLLAEAGLSNADIIDATSINASKILKRTDALGKVIKGYQANLVLLNSNPIKDISALKDISEVIKSGRVVNRASLITKNSAIQPQGVDCNIEVENANRQASKTIDDFKSDIKWKSISDNMMGGSSKAELVKNSKTMIIKTSLGKPTAFGSWAGAQIMFNEPVDASKYQGIKITYKGSDSHFGMSIYHADVKDWDHFSNQLSPSKEWTTKEIKFTDLKQFGFGNQVKWSAKNLTGLNIVWRQFNKNQKVIKDNLLEISEVAYF